MLSTVQQVKETLLIGTFNIGLPTVDVGSDGTLIYTLYRGFPYHPNCTYKYWYDGPSFETCLAGIKEDEMEYEHHPTWATLLFVPFLLNYFASWFAWYRMDKRKKITWLACVFNVYPQLRAANIIREMWRDPERGLAKKRKFEREISGAEVFLEAVYTTFVMTCIGKHVSSGRNYRARYHLGNNSTLFRITFYTSFITAGLGMAKALRSGVCHILPEKGLLGGFLSCRFILIFLACFVTLFGKAGIFSESRHCSLSDKTDFYSTIFAFLAVTLPGLITGMIFIRHCSLLKTFITHPSLMLLPAYTFFSFESNTKCCPCNHNSQNEVEITFSVKATCFNILFSLASVIVYILTSTKFPDDFYRNGLGYTSCTEVTQYVILLVGILLTLILLLTTCPSSCCPNACSLPSDQPSSCSAPSSSCSSCSAPSPSVLCPSCLSSSCVSTSCFPPLEFGIYLPFSPDKVFIKDQIQLNRRKEIKENEVEEEERDEKNEGDDKGD